MASLQDIMNVDEDQLDSHTNKKDQLPASSSIYHQPYLAPSPTYNSGYATGGEQPDSLTTTKKRSPSSRATKSSTSPSSSSGRPTTTRRRSNVSPETMDPSSYAHGYAGPSSGAYDPSVPPTRPFSHSPSGSEMPVKLTPITGRVSRAKKGMKVHTCDICRPPKTFTRAEHLRRHQLSHDTPQYACSVPGCDRAFHRKDLLERHQQRHELEGDRASRSGGASQSRRTSAGSLEGGVRALGLQPPVLGYPTNTSTPNSNLPMTPNISNSGPYQSISAPDVGKSLSPHMGNDYRPSSGGPGYGGGYTLSGQSQQPILQHSPNHGYDTTPTFSTVDYSSQPRTTPEFPPLYLQTHGLGIQLPASDGPPELSHTQDNAGWQSSASDSTYSTPSDNSRRNALWPTARANTEWQSNLLPPYRDANLDAIATTTPMFYQFSTSPQINANQVFPILDVSMSGFSDEHTLLDPHQQSRFANTVRSPTPPVTSASAQSSETLVTPSTALPSDRMMNSLACLGRQKEVALGLLAAPTLMQGSLPLPPANVYKAIPNYLEVYWEKVHHVFPIVHRRTFEAAAEQVDVLRCAMAAVATQYMSAKEDRIRGSQLHEYAWQQSRRDLQFLQWDVPVMQSILLCEFFARFRGRRAAIRPSKEFESIYSRVSDNSVIFGTVPMTGPNTVRWHTWLDMETRRRLLAACFVLDSHTSVYLEQQRVRDFDIAASGIPPIPLTGPTNDLWEAASADAWSAMVASKGDTSNEQSLLSLINPDTLSSTSINAHVPFDRSIILAFESLLLPTRDETEKVSLEVTEPETYRMANIFPECPVANTYLALHHTPLHDLLAVSGDSWIFSQKVLQPKSFAEHQKRLSKWCDSRDAAVAVVFACRALRAFTEHGNADEDCDEDEEMDVWEMGRPRMWKDDISDYWGMYVCALICWAYGHRTNRSQENGYNTSNEAGDESSALRWMRTVASMRAKDVLKLRSKKDAITVVTLVRRWLDMDCIGGRSRLYVDAVGVLKKLEEGVNWKWF
ncbi:C2H2 finger domain-containing protein [Colletotrichum truncatum]|uniref:C2H2 finger domain-containing protein n=1 Tax=Colletotrichum truncatum TaxID=5467 RepID=A0ACC3ZDT1_COLTU|nr:C2H2 finger domain-containing protein [Colletotrichum truncatum]KAF6794827.1 C2H2 finger domain-containing protein [Colletotrichum truncatum]